MSTYTLAAATRRRGAVVTPPVDPPPVDPGWTYSHLATVGPSGRQIPIPPGWQVWWYDSFDYADLNTMLAAKVNGSPIWAAYSGQDAAYGTGYWSPSHVTLAGSQVILNGYFDNAVASGKYVTGGIATSGLALGGNIPAGGMWVWCTREEAAGAAPVKVAGMTYGTITPWQGQYLKNGNPAGNGIGEWPYCGEIDAREGPQGASSLDVNLHWSDPTFVSSANPSGHAQQKLGTLPLDTTKWVIHGHRVDPDGTYRAFTNDAAAADQPLREWLTKTGVDPSFLRGGRRWINQQEAYAQPAAGTGTLKVYVDWVALLVPTAKGLWTPPATILDLKSWKATLPVDVNNATTGTAVEWKHPQIETASHAAFLAANSAGTGVTFTANAGGAKTGSSDNARSELRQLQADGVTLASFGSNDGKDHVIEGVLQIDHLPDHLPKLSFLQCHGADAASFLLLLADGYRITKPGSSTYVHGAGTDPFSLILKVNDSTSTQVRYVTLLAGVTLGQPVSVKVVIGGGELVAYADAGTAGATTERDRFTANIPVDGLYWKAGCYLQSNLDNGTKTVPGTAQGNPVLTAPIVSGQLAGNAAVTEYGAVTYFDLQISDSDGGGGTPAPAAPSDLLDLTKWKTTFPIHADGSVGNSPPPLEVTQPQLTGYTRSPYFFDQRAPDGVNEVVYYSPANGATTSNTANPRCEDREMADTTGKNLAAWSTTSGVHTQWLVGRVLQLPTNKPQLVLMQMHDPSLDFEVIADGFSSMDGVAVHDQGTGGFCIGHRDWAGKQQYDVPLLSNVHIGDVYSLAFVVNAGGAGNIQMYADFGAVPLASMTLKKTYPAGSHTGVFFKSGAYTQANSTNADSSGPKHVPSATPRYPGLPALTSPTPGSNIAGEPAGSAGCAAIRQRLVIHA